jgi:aminodeoxyfutalosine synthase
LSRPNQMNMSTALDPDTLMERVDAGENLTPAEITALADTPDILLLGMLADAIRRRLHGTTVTYVRVATCEINESFSEKVLPVAREVRLAGAPDSLDVAVTAVTQAKAVAGERVVSGFSWSAIEALATGGTSIAGVLTRLREAGLEAIAHVPLDTIPDPAAAIEMLAAAEFTQLRLAIDNAPAAERTALLIRASALQQRFKCIHAINPLPSSLSPGRPTTGYEDVRMVAIARLAAPDVPVVQVDWLRYGPKLAQVALTFGADDLDGVTASEEAPEGRRRAPLEEVRRNIEAAGFAPAERDGRFLVTT